MGKLLSISFHCKFCVVLFVETLLLLESCKRCSGQVNVSSSLEKLPVNELSHLNLNLFTCCNLRIPPGGSDFDQPEASVDHCGDHISKASDQFQSPQWQIPSEFMSTNSTCMANLRQRKPACTKSFLNVTLVWNNSSNDQKLILYPNSYLRIQTEFYAPDEFCINGFSDIGVEILACPPNCEDRPCIPKCCTMDKVYSIGLGIDGSNQTKPGCKPIRDSKKSGVPHFFNPPLYRDFNTKMSAEETSQAPMPHFVFWSPSKFIHNCPKKEISFFPSSQTVADHISRNLNLPIPFNPLTFHIRHDGSFMYRNILEQKCNLNEDPKSVSCVDGLQDYDYKDFEFHNFENQYIAVICKYWNVKPVEQENHSPKNYIYGGLLLTLSVFPLATSVVYFLLWSKQTVHGWTIATTTGCLFCWYVTHGLALIVTEIRARTVTETSGCIAIAILSHFFFLATFTWLTVMCYDLFWTFWCLTPTNRRSSGMRKFVKYSVFSWGLPFAYVGGGIIMDFATDDCTQHTVPGYGRQSCSILHASQGMYIFYPLATLLASNCIFFAVTCFKLCRYRQNTKFATRRDTSDWQCFSRFSKLFLVMGVSWIFDVLSWSISGLSHRWPWLVLDTINIFRAVGVFIVYVCKQDIYSALEDLYPCFKKIFGHFKRKCSTDEMSVQTVSTVQPSPINPSVLNAI